jgi:hypothetical protein
MNKLRSYYSRQRGRQKIHPANRRYFVYKCLNCRKYLRSDVHLLNNEEVCQLCTCGYLNKFTWDDSYNMMQRMRKVGKNFELNLRSKLE